MSVVEYVNKYKRRLYPDNDLKKIKHAILRLNDLEMTVDILKDTGIGKIVNNFRKSEEVGELAKNLVAKWKLLLAGNTPSVGRSKPERNIKYETKVNYSLGNENGNEYDPSANWNMAKNESQKYEEENDEYDPNKNWEMKDEQSTSHDNEYDPTQNWEMEKIKKEKKLCGDTGYFPQKKIKEKKKLKKITRSPQIERYSPQRQCYDSSDSGPDEISKNRYESDVSDHDTNQNRRNIFDAANSYSPSKKKTNNSSHEIQSKSKTKRDKTKQKSNVYTKESSNPKRSLNKDNDFDKKSKINTSKRKSTSEIKSPHNKKLKVEKTKGKHKKSDQKDEGLSFEDFMAMDTSKMKTKKANKVSMSLGKKANASNSKIKLDLHLPEVQANYTPLPHHELRAHSSRTPAMTDAVAAELHTQRNTKRMQIYSGQKTSTISHMMSLYDQCMNVLVNNIDHMDVIGVPYDIIKPVLERCTVEQLYRLEDANVYLIEDSDELWHKHSRSDFKGYEPEEMESWREMYLRLHDAREVKLAKLTHSIQAKLNKAKPLESRTKLAYVGIGQAKAPRNVQRAQLKYGTAGPKPIPNGPSTSHGGSSIKNQVVQIRRGIPAGTITASVVDNMPNGRSKKIVPRKAPMLAKTLNSINKLRYRR